MCKAPPKTYEELSAILERPFDILDMRIVPKWRADKRDPPWNPFKEPPRGFYLTTIDAQAVKERLNEAFGYGGWAFEDEYEERDGEILCRGKLVVRWKGDSEFEKSIPSVTSALIGKSEIGNAYKSARTSAISKAASELGIGSEVFRGRITAAVWVERCKTKGIKSLSQWRDGGLSLSEMTGPEAAKAKGKEKGRRQGGARKNRYPVTSRLLDAAKVLGIPMKDCFGIVKDALGEDRKLIDIREKDEQRKVLAQMMRRAADSDEKVGLAKGWLGIVECGSLDEFIERAQEGVFTLDHLTNYLAYINDELDEEAPEKAPAENGKKGNGVWSVGECLNAWVASGLVERKQLEAAVKGKSSEKWTKKDLAELQIAYEEMKEDDLTPAQVLKI